MPTPDPLQYLSHANRTRVQFVIDSSGLGPESYVIGGCVTGPACVTAVDRG